MTGATSDRFQPLARADGTPTADAALVAAVRAAVGGTGASDEFATQAVRDLDGETGEPERLAALWRFGQEATGDAPSLRLRHDGADDLLEVVQPDGPFLVDAVVGALGEAGVALRSLVHPLVAGRSLIQATMEPVGEDRGEALLAGVRAALDDARVATADRAAMRDLLERCIAVLAAEPTAAAREEGLAFLRWLDDRHFVFLGARDYAYARDAAGGYAAEEPDIVGAGLGVLRDPGRYVLRRGSEPAVLSAALADQAAAGGPVVVAKANLRSRVHRRAYMDYVGVRRLGPDGRPAGETRFVGLFTEAAYDEPVRETPLVRRKAEAVLASADVAPGGHSDKRLRNILETYPRDELFQTDEASLLATCLGVLHLSDRPRVRLFARRDAYNRFVSVLLYVPRERYDSTLRAAAGRLLAEAYGGRVSAFYPSFSDQPLARVHFIIGLDPGAAAEPDLAALEAQIADAARSWEDRFETAARAGGVATGEVAATLARYAGAFSPGYRAANDASDALADLREIEAARNDEEVRLRAYRRPGDSPRQFRFKLYRRDTAAPLSDVLPILDNMGLRTLTEAGFPLARPGLPVVWVHDFLLEDEAGEKLNFADVQDPFEAAFAAVWTGRTESDGFNRLVLELGVSWREAALIRTLARYRQQSGLDPSQAVQEQALRDHPEIARLLLDLFRTRFDPAVGASADDRRGQAQAVFDAITTALQQVASLDHDRVLRRLALLVQATVRTNYYQAAPDGAPKPYISIKLASRELDDLPAPKPYREIFVWAPHVEGVHLRFGPVARGGLRWSDRRDDFRTEVLGLVKAQQVKNAVIVPVGSKGGFYPKQLPRPVNGQPPAADLVRAEGVRAYRTFLSGLLDVTDNLDAAGKVVPPADVVRLDGDDPYLVVAADKGTATFSDIANGVAADYGFWLGDAFASGGSAGYDHKAMGITARGAWEAVKRHFRERGKDIQAEPFTCVGVGDMSGDVFGNGALLSKQMRLLAAFDHRHIFLDPDPDPATSWAERDRLFALPRSSWDDYDKAVISAGGGVYPRTAKTVSLTQQVKAMLDLTADQLSPADLIRAILKARAELLYLGGIGTYVKAANESDAQVGDKANDVVRITGAELRCLVVGEGANLGMTQAGRIEYARAGADGRGGRSNTDAIDNSAGVDTSDHEVNIKILTSAAEAAGRLAPADRDPLLASMTDAVASHVLQHNYDQTLALTLMQADAAADLDNQARFMADLEARGRLDRRVEGLPDAAQLAALGQAGQGLTRPELSVLLAYGKLDLFDEAVKGSAVDDPFFLATLRSYFPEQLAPYEPEMRRHRLRREIVATVLANRVVNLAGPSFPGRLRAAAACDTDALLVGFTAARQILRLQDGWDAVSALDGKAPADAQTQLYLELSRALRGQTFWLARRAFRPVAGKSRPTVQALIDEYRPGVDALRADMPGLLSPFEQEAVAARAAGFVAAGAPEALARQVAQLRPLTTAGDLVDLGQQSSWSVGAVGRLYHQVGGAFGFDRLRAAAGGRAGGDHFERMAMRRLIADMLAEQTELTRQVMAFIGSGKPGAEATADPEAARKAVDSWTALHPDAARSVRRTIEEIEQAPGGWTFAKLTIANAALRELVTA